MEIHDVVTERRKIRIMEKSESDEHDGECYVLVSGDAYTVSFDLDKNGRIIRWSWRDEVVEINIDERTIHGNR